MLVTKGKGRGEKIGAEAALFIKGKETVPPGGPGDPRRG